MIHLSLHKHNTRALIRCLLPRLLQARRAGSLLACFRMRLLFLCVRNDERNCLHLTSVSNSNYRNWYNFLAYKKENRRKNDMVPKDSVILGVDELMIKRAFRNSRFSWKCRYFRSGIKKILLKRFAYSFAYSRVGDVTFILMLYWCYQSYNIRCAIGIFNNIENIENQCTEILPSLEAISNDGKRITLDLVKF